LGSFFTGFCRLDFRNLAGSDRPDEIKHSQFFLFLIFIADFANACQGFFLAPELPARALAISSDVRGGVPVVAGEGEVRQQQKNTLTQRRQGSARR